MNAQEYVEYQQAVAEFFDREGITNLFSGRPWCPDCGGDTADEWQDTGACPKCGADRECAEEPYFSWHPCDCCGSRLGGNREHATGYNPETGEIQEYEICTDCVYYAEYGCLDDTMMLEIEGGR